MAAKKIMVAREAKLFGEGRMVRYATKHGFTLYPGTYRIVKKHSSPALKEIGPYGRVRTSSEQEEFCEIIKVAVLRKGRCPVEGYLVGYASKGIRFDAHTKY